MEILVNGAGILKEPKVPVPVHDVNCHSFEGNEADEVETHPCRLEVLAFEFANAT